MPPTTAKDLTGQRFGLLTVVGRAPANTAATKRAHWLCQCECGMSAVKLGKYLLCGDTTSCGCAQAAYRASGNSKKYGTSLVATHPREYTIWRSMKSRCYVTSASNYRFYGGRGVTVCDEWRDDFAVFIRDMGRCPEGQTLDRTDPSDGYHPENCRWSTWATQHNNTRRSLRYVCSDGVTRTLADIARRERLPYLPLHNRIRKRGKHLQDAINDVRHAAASKLESLIRS